ncbi:hypothetical protein E4U55_003662 [Claviceps digitariae]|nr:hypothetical protein E4U55_003662 [Claviceps digitariae]
MASSAWLMMQAGTQGPQEPSRLLIRAVSQEERRMASAFQPEAPCKCMADQSLYER